MRLDVVGVSVTAVGVVGHHDMRSKFGDHGRQLADNLIGVGIDELGSLARRCPRHTRIPPPSGSTEESRFAEPEVPQRGGQFADAVATQLIGVIDTQMLPRLPDDLALLAEGARQHGHLGAERGIARHGHTVVDGLVIGMSVHEQQPRNCRHRPSSACVIARRRHPTDSGSAGSETAARSEDDGLVSVADDAVFAVPGHRA